MMTEFYMKTKDWVNDLLINQPKTITQNNFQEFCPSNIALVKYWGKRNLEFNLPTHSSISISLANKGATCTINISDNDTVIVNNNNLDKTSQHYTRIINFIDLLTPTDREKLTVTLTVNIPIAAGLASSACIFASITKAIAGAYDWKLDNSSLSKLARMGSGSASRSLYDGFVLWQCGKLDNGSDSVATQLPTMWPEFRIGLLINSSEKKKISSTDAMIITQKTSKLFAKYAQDTEEVFIPQMLDAIANKDFNKLGNIAEDSAKAMHNTMHSSHPEINYDNDSTILCKEKIKNARNNGLDIYYTQDAGPNVKIMFLEKDTEKVMDLFASCEIIKPFDVNHN
jgi:diphosphomevalonate decarboxylase